MEEEISLRELIEVLLKGKWTILSVSLIALLAGTVFTYFPKPAPQYQAEARIYLRQIVPDFSPSASNHFTSFIKAVQNAERYDAEAVSVLIKRPDFLSEISKDLYSKGQTIPQHHLAQALTVSVAGSNTLIIQAEDTDKVRSKLIVNAVTEKFSAFLAVHQREQVTFIAKNLERNVSLELQGLEASLHQLEEVRANFEPLITYRDNSYFTPEYSVLSADIARILSQIAQLNAQLAEIKALSASLDDMLRDVGSGIDYVSAQAATDITPPPRRLNIAVAGLLGLMVSVFLVFFINYWKETAPASKAG